ncbi:Endogenous retrovirus group K member 7 Pro protein [Manis javanica]|nr:Endogenous retrovirus group K member 7 Pro protein [Manis javanica]
MTDFQGIGKAWGPLQSSQTLVWSNKEEHTGTFQPYILDHLPVNLWGWDILTQMSVLLFSPSPQVAQMMLNQGRVPGTG